MKNMKNNDKKLLQYLLNKEKVCPLDKQEMYQLQELIQKERNKR